MKRYERALAGFTPVERDATVELMTSWHREGITQGKETLVLRLLRRRVGPLSPEITAQLDTLSPEQLDDLGEALPDFSSPADLEQWLLRS